MRLGRDPGNSHSCSGEFDARGSRRSVCCLSLVHSGRNAHQTVQVMEPFDVGRKATAVFLIDLDVIWGKAGFMGIFR